MKIVGDRVVDRPSLASSDLQIALDLMFTEIQNAEKTKTSERFPCGHFVVDSQIVYILCHVV